MYSLVRVEYLAGGKGGILNTAGWQLTVVIPYGTRVSHSGES